MTAKIIMDVYHVFPFYITINKFGRVLVHWPKHRTVNEVANVLLEIIHINNERYLYRLGSPENNSDTIHNKPALDRSKQKV